MWATDDSVCKNTSPVIYIFVDSLTSVNEKSDECIVEQHLAKNTV